MLTEEANPTDFQGLISALISVFNIELGNNYFTCTWAEINKLPRGQERNCYRRWVKAESHCPTLPSCPESWHWLKVRLGRKCKSCRFLGEEKEFLDRNSKWEESIRSNIHVNRPSNNLTPLSVYPFSTYGSLPPFQFSYSHILELSSELFFQLWKKYSLTFHPSLFSLCPLVCQFLNLLRNYRPL